MTGCAGAAADPATWMLDISTVSAEERIGRDLSDAYAGSRLHECAHHSC